MRSIAGRAFLLFAWLSVQPCLADELQQPQSPPPQSLQPPSPQPPLPTAPAVLQDAVRISPLPKISLLIPKGWFACDSAINAQLGGGAIPPVIATKICSGPLPPGMPVRLIDPNLMHFMFLIMGREDYHTLGVTPEDFTSESEDARRQVTDGICAKFKGTNAQRICTMAFGRVAGHPALTGTLEDPQPDNKLGMRMRIVAVAQHDGLVVLALAYVDPASTASITDAIIDSIELE